MHGYFELQLSITSLAGIMVEQLRSAGITLLNEFDLEGDRYLIDHLDFGSARLTSATHLSSAVVKMSVPRNFGLDEFITIPNVRGVILRQQVTFFITTESALAASGAASQRTWAIEAGPGIGVTVPVLNCSHRRAQRYAGHTERPGCGH